MAMKNKGVFALLFAAFCVILLLSGCGARGYAPVLRANWDLALPDACRETYEIDSGESFQGDGVRYHVYALEDADALAAVLEDWSGRAGQSTDENRLTEKAEEYLTELSVPVEEQPAYENCLCWFKAGEHDSRDQILLLLDKEAGRLYVMESFM